MSNMWSDLITVQPAVLAANTTLQRKCDCGQHTIAGSKCDECGKKDQSLQRTTRSSELETKNSGGVPPIVPEVLRSSGQPLDPTSRAFFEPRFGHDFSHVRVHTDARAAESAQAVNALAYTVGPNVVFASGQYGTTDTARALLAHELAHVIQQSSARPPLAPIQMGQPADRFEQAADQLAHQVMNGAVPATSNQSAGRGQVLQRQPVPGGDDPVLEVGTGSPLEASFSGSMTLDKFGLNKSELTEEHKAELRDHAKRVNQLLKRYRDSFISLTGHTDAVGTEESNQELGQKRADAVLAELAKDGVPPDILRAGSLGETAPMVATKNAEPRNRRVDLTFHARSFLGGKLLGEELKLGTPKASDKLPGFISEPKVPKLDLSLPPAQQTFPGPFDPNLGIPSKAPPKTSASKFVFDKVDSAINPLIKGLPPWVQERIRSGAHSLIEKGATSLLDQALDASSLGDSGKEAVRKAVEASMKIEF
jgi:outer membrane protein OmpA-like peptidoglycan-associated protein